MSVSLVARRDSFVSETGGGKIKTRLLAGNGKVIT